MIFYYVELTIPSLKRVLYPHKYIGLFTEFIFGFFIYAIISNDGALKFFSYFFTYIFYAYFLIVFFLYLSSCSRNPATVHGSG